ncbi:DUF1302 domain-containing protein [Pseudomonas typographi]|uniref:DUF1302 domain-containing protein n=1 Tax=Pseudomonas typographi TaxID=2715964 RepID=UPI0016867339|nr:DUF1302 family protein [Pseudomonas typographi]MBD1552572.1 DUF1302 domain-containing protein [Pseudomonas typographi]MBD1586152.1 DUF1302 domain-containing protein [Pseudomonas typographi]
MNDMTKRGRGFLSQGAAALLAFGASSAFAASFDLPNPDYRLRVDTTIRYTLGIRADGQDSRIMNTPTYDESDGKFDKGDVVTNRLDLLSEIDFSYLDDWGARLSASGWYDQAYDDGKVHSNVPGYSTSYHNSHYSSQVNRYVNGPSGEILDAFVWRNFSVGSVPVNVKIGRHTNYWGEGLLFGAHAISYSQAPSDGVKAATSPGIETKEVFLPVGQISAKAQVTDSLSVAGQYFYEWDNTRIPYGGTYFGSADPFFEGPDQFPASAGLDLQRRSSRFGRDNANWGVMAKLNVEAIESTFGVYYRQFDDYQPWLVPELRVAQGDYRIVYPRGVKLLGLSFSRVFDSVAVGTEVSYRKDGALNTTGVDAADEEGPRGDTLHAVANAVYGLPRTFISDGGTLVGEFAFSHLNKVTEHEELFKGGSNCSGGTSQGCSTRNYYAVAANYTPQYQSIFPSWDLDIPLTVNYGLHGNAASAGGGNEGALSWSIGAKMTYRAEYEFTLRYADTHAQSKNGSNNTVAGNGAVGTTDRGWLALTFKTSF